MHDTPLVCIYDEHHEVIGEAHVRSRLFRLPAGGRGVPHRIGLSAKPLMADAEAELVLNLRTHE